VRRAFLVGSNGPDFQPKLKFAESDAEKIRACLASPICNFIVNEPKQHASRYEILADLDHFFGAADDEDTVVFYFSGHGAVPQGDLHLLFSFSEKARLPFTSISINEIRDKLKFCRAQNKLVILDCCHAGAIYDQNGVKSAGEELDFRDLNIESESHIAFVAGTRFERAREDEKFGSGAFTHFIIDAIQSRPEQADIDRDGLISIQDLERWIPQQLDRENIGRQKQERFPRPYLIGEQKGLFYLTLMRDVIWQWPDICGVKRAHDAKIVGGGCTIGVTAHPRGSCSLG
jgi:hypothetical protein